MVTEAIHKLKFVSILKKFFLFCFVLKFMAQDPPKVFLLSQLPPATTPKGRFKALARMIKTNLAWTREQEEKPEQSGQDNTFVVKDKENALVFDVNAFKAASTGYGGLHPKARRILQKHPIDRSDEELHVLKVSYTFNPI